jgi:AAA domain/CHC2 zinc finger
MTFDPDYLDRLRAAVRVSEVVGRRHKLRKVGGEFEAIDNTSLKVNDKKNVWKDWGNGTEKGGDIFAWFQQEESLSFIEAVERVAQISGIGLPKSQKTNGAAHRNGAVGNGVAPDDSERDRRRSGARQEIVGTWDYTDAKGMFLYQTIRVQWRNPDGSWILEKSGKPKKSFRQRRRAPGGIGGWIYGLDVIDSNTGDPHEFMRRDGGDWYRYDPDNYRNWGCVERRCFPDLGNVVHTLLNLPAVIENLREERSFQHTIFIPEGEKKVDLLKAWGLIATTNSGGAKNWHVGMAKLLEDAADIVILEDNDDASRERTAKMAPMLLEHGCRVRVLSFPTIWPECPPKGDVVDWMIAGGTASDLAAAVEKLTDWQPPPYQSRFGAHTWGAHRDPAAIDYKWRIKGLMPAGLNILIIGPSGSGKTFETTGMGLAVARGIDYCGRKVERAGVVYCNYEGSRGMPKRLLAYEKFHSINQSEIVPFAWLSRPPGLFATEENATELANEVKAITKDWTWPVGVIIVDTHNAATRGSSEIDSKDVGKIMERYAKVQAETGAELWIVGHTNSEGKHRGNEQIPNGIDTILLIDRINDGSAKNPRFARDNSNKVLRRVTVKKQRDGVDGIQWDFVLQPVEVGRDEDNEPITSMVSVSPNVDPDEIKTPRRRVLSQEEKFFMGALREALERDGQPPPAGLNLPRSITSVTTWDAFARAYETLLPGDKPPAEKLKAQWQSIAKGLMNRKVTFGRNLGGVYYVWIVKDPTSEERRQDTIDALYDNATGAWKVGDL